MEQITYCYRFGTAELDEARCELRVAGLPVELERRAMDVLAYLLRHAGEVVTKDELLREVWAGRVTVEKVLPNAISKIRRALGQENAERIATQARIGYRLDGSVSRVAVGRWATDGAELTPDRPVPGRTNFILRKPLGAHRGSEVWLAEHAKTREQRVYKFALDGERLRSLKRETTLLRVLHEGSDDASHFVGLIDWNFEHAPFFVECENGGVNLLEWAEAALPGMSIQARIALFLQVADAVDAAHALGVLHKDIKPTNVLVAEGKDGPHVRLVDFGSARMLEPERLEALGITRQGLTLTQDLGTDSYSGTPLYLAPEVFAGHTPTVRSDVYALGILLCQLLTGRLREPMASGWEAEIGDPLLREDIRLATDGNPERRLASVAALTERLRRLDQRRDALAARAAAEAEALRARDALARSRARRPIVVALMLAMAVGLAVAVVLQFEARRARAQAESELARASAMVRFVEEDLIGRANPLILGKGADAPIRDVLLAARDRLATRFADQPLTGASLRVSLAGLFNTIDLWTEGEAEARAALAVFEGTEGEHTGDTLHARAMLVRVLSRMARFDEARTELEKLKRPTSAVEPARHAYRVASAESMLLLSQGNFSDAVPSLRAAIDAHRTLGSESLMQRDSLTLDLVIALGLTGDAAEAIRIYESFVTEVEARPGDTRTLRALAHLGVARSVSLEGDHPRAEALLLDAQKTIVAQLGADHSRHLSLLNELMGVYFRQSDWERALPIAREVHERIREKLGDAHNSTWVTYGNLGRTLYESGRSELAVGVLDEAHRRLAASVGADNPQVQDIAFALAGAALSLGHTDGPAAVLDQLDPAQLEKGRATGRWEASIRLLQGLRARLLGDIPTASRLLGEALDAHRDDDAYAQSRLIRDARAALESLRTPVP